MNKRDNAKDLTALLGGAVQKYGGMCASAVIEALNEFFCAALGDDTIASGVGVRFSSEDGDARCIFVGTALFIAAAARKRGLKEAETIGLCADWQSRFEALPPGERAGAAALFEAQHFIEENGAALVPERELSKPERYYEGIYNDREAMFRHSPYALEEKLTKAVSRGDEALALKALREINAQGEKSVLAKNPLRSVKNSMIGSIAFLARAAIAAGVGASDAFALSDALTQSVEDMDSRQDVLNFEENILLQFLALVHRRLEESYSAPITRVMHYIENRLDTKIRLPEAAEYAGLHPAYLSARFKRETGLSFTGYVAMRKIQESSYFVRHTDYSVSQIASLYGFSSQSYYITTFKSVLGMTPEEYRRRLMTE